VHADPSSRISQPIVAFEKSQLSRASVDGVVPTFRTYISLPTFRTYIISLPTFRAYISYLHFVRTFVPRMYEPYQRPEQNGTNIQRQVL